MIAVPGYTEGVGVAMLVVPRAEVEAQGEETLANAIAQQLGGQRKWETLWLSDLLRSPSALISGTTISRADIVGYVANRLGGAHGGSKHPVKKEQKWILLDRHWALLQHLNAIYLELLSIGQFLAFSTDVERFIDQFRGVPAPPSPLAQSF